MKRILIFFLVIFCFPAIAMMKDVNEKNLYTLRTYLHDAVRNNCLIKTENVLKNMKLAKIDVANLLNTDSPDLAYEAFKKFGKDSDAIIKLLINYGYNVNYVNDYDRNRLFEALVKGGSLDEVKFLLAWNASFRNKDGSYPLLANFFYYKNSPEKIKLLVESDHNIDVNALDIKGRNCLYYVKSAEMVNLFKKIGVNFDIKDKYGHTVLQKFMQEIEVPQQMINLKKCCHFTEKEIDDIFNEDYIFECIKAFVENGMDVNTRNSEGATALFDANTEETINFFLNLGANTDAQDEKGETALFKFVKDDKIDLVNCLLNNKANVLLVNNQEETVLHCVQSLEMLRLLLANNKIRTIINQPDKENATPFFIQLKRKPVDLKIIKYFIQEGADISICAENKWHKYEVFPTVLKTNNPELLKLMFAQGVAISCFCIPSDLTLSASTKKVFDFCAEFFNNGFLEKTFEQKDNIERELCCFLRACVENNVDAIQKFITLGKDYPEIFNWKTVLLHNKKNKHIFYCLVQLNTTLKDLSFLGDKNSSEHDNFVQELYQYNKLKANKKFGADVLRYACALRGLQKKQLPLELCHKILSYE